MFSPMDTVGRVKVVCAHDFDALPTELSRSDWRARNATRACAQVAITVCQRRRSRVSATGRMNASAT